MLIEWIKLIYLQQSWPNQAISRTEESSHFVDRKKKKERNKRQRNNINNGNNRNNSKERNNKKRKKRAFDHVGGIEFICRRESAAPLWNDQIKEEKTEEEEEEEGEEEEENIKQIKMK